jgi:hypothetical protein
MLPTEDKTEILLNTYVNNTHSCKAIYHISELLKTSINDRNDLRLRGYKYQHLYITSDDEIKEGDWYKVMNDKYNNGIKSIAQADKEHLRMIKENPRFICKKIIATTDKSLVIGKEHDDTVPYLKMRNKYLPQPSQSFIKKYCELDGIDKVLVEYEKHIDQHPDWRPTYSDPDNSGGAVIEFYLPKTDSHNTITIKPIEPKLYTEEQIIQIVNDYWNLPSSKRPVFETYIKNL